MFEKLEGFQSRLIILQDDIEQARMSLYDACSHFDEIVDLIDDVLIEREEAQDKMKKEMKGWRDRLWRKEL